MLIAVCQINSLIGDVENNKRRIISLYRKAQNDNADLAVFPELALTGYPPQDLVEKKEFRDAVKKAALEIASETGSTGLIFGSITEDDDKIGTDISNSAIFCSDGKIQSVQSKTLIPNYDVFDEMRYFDPARSAEVYPFKNEKLGVSICEDIWNDADYWHYRRYVTDPVKKLIDKNASIIINISASPYSFGKREARKQMLAAISGREKLPLVYVCYAGAQTDLIFDGASMCFDDSGSLVLMGKTYGEDYFLFDTSKKYTPVKKVEASFEEEVLRCLIFGVKEYFAKTGFKKAVVGLSGGIDSALVTYVAVEALGRENVKVLMMPSEFSSRGSIDDSECLIKNLGITAEKISIQPVFESIKKELKPVFKDLKEGLTEENIQARIRGIYLMAYSNRFNYLLLTTGNKSEMAVGYCTLYGDMAGGLAVLADVYKTDIYRIARYINKETEIIPNSIIDKAPSAELKHNQTDQDTLPAYDLLDQILRMYLEENKEFNEISKIIGNPDVVHKVLRMVDLNEFKRKQAAPAIRVSKKAFGYGRRYPIVQGWRK